MAGKTVVDQVQLGDSATDSQNFLLKTNIDGTMKLARGAAGNLGDVMVVNADGGMKGNQPAFEAYLQSAQTVTTGVLTKIQLNVEVFDTANAFDNVTNYRFQPLVAGYYQINTRMRGDATTTLGNFNLSLYKNGALYERVCEAAQATAITISGSCLVYLNGTTDYIEFFGMVNGTGTCTFSTAGDTTGLYGPRVSGYLVRAA